MSLWGGRFDGTLNDKAWELNASLPVDRNMALEDVEGSLAWAGGLFAAEVLSYQEHADIANGLELIAREFQSNTFQFQAGDEDIHSAVERRLTELIGPTAKKLHTGRSRNDQVATDFRLWMLHTLPAVVAEIESLQASLVKLAEDAGETMMPGYTHLQRAQPILLAHWWLSHFWPLERDKSRLADLSKRVSVLPLGCGALAGNPIGVDRPSLAAALGFETCASNSLDAVSDRDFVAEFLFCCSLIGTHISKMSEQIILFTSSEFGFFELADEYSTGSSLMPQKKNPDIFELGRGKAGTLLGLLVGFMATLKGLPSTYDKDLQEDKAPVFKAAETLLLMLPVISAAARTMKPNAVRMRAAIDSFMMVTDLADYLVRKGIPFRETHELAGKAVRLAMARQTGLDGLTLEQYKQIHPMFEADVYQSLDPAFSIQRRNSLGGTAPQAVRIQIKEAKSLLQGE